MCLFRKKRKRVSSCDDPFGTVLRSVSESDLARMAESYERQRRDDAHKVSFNAQHSTDPQE